MASLVLLVGVVLILYGRSAGFAFLAWDDDQNIVNNKWLATGQWQRFWLQPFLCMYIPPVYSLWYLLSLLATPLDPHVFHAANIAVHALNTVLVYQLARIAIKTRLVAVLAALAFAVHPLQVEAVAWVTGMRDMLSATGVLIATICYLRWGERGPTRLGNVCGWLAFVFALLCKPSAAALPAALFVIGVFVQRRPLGAVVRELAAWFSVVIPFIWVTQWAQMQIADPFASSLHFLQRLAVTADSYSFYLQKWLIPTHLTSDYGRTPAVVLAGSNAVELGLGLAAVILILVGLYFGRERLRVSLGWLAFAALLIVPTSGIVAFAFQHTSTVTDHYAYLAVAGMSLALGSILSRVKFGLVAVLGAAMLSTWFFLSWSQLSVWRDDTTHFPAMVAANSHSYAGWTGLAALDMKSSAYEKALAELLEAEKIDPLKVDLLANKALALNKLGRYQQVLDEIAPHLPNQQIVVASPISALSVASMFMMVAYANLKFGHNAEALPYVCMAQWADASNHDVQVFLPIVAAKLSRSLADKTLCAPFIN